MATKRFRLPKITVSVFSVVLFVLLGITLFLKPDCKSLYFNNTYATIFGIAAIALQLFLNRVNWRSQNKILILATLFISAMVVGGAILQFIGILKVCE